jgi:hypothetical protein
VRARAGKIPQPQPDGSNVEQALARRPTYVARTYCAALSSTIAEGCDDRGGHHMKPYILMLLIGTIAALSDLIGRDEAANGKRGQAPLIGAVPRHIGRRFAAMTFAPSPRLLALPLLLLLVTPAQAQERNQELTDQVEVGTSLICNTREQVERFVALYDGNSESTVNSVNAAVHDPTACAVSTMAYVRGRELATARNKDTTFQIVPILVLGVVTESGVESVTPAPFFSVFEIEEIGI